MSDKKIYKVEKKKEYKFQDYTDVISAFNDSLIELLDNICDICLEKKWKTEQAEFGSYITTVQAAVKANKEIAIKTFASSVYPYYNYIKARKEDMLLHNDYSKMGDVNMILKYKKLWLESGELNKEYLFQTTEFLCYLTDHYEDIATSLKIIKVPTTLLK